MALPGGGSTTYPSPPITFRVTWSSSLVDDTNYYVRVSLDVGSGYNEIGTTTTSATQMDYQYEDYVQNAAYFSVTQNFTFKVDVIARSTGLSVSTNTASALSSITVGKCNGLQ